MATTGKCLQPPGKAKSHLFTEVALSGLSIEREVPVRQKLCGEGATN